MKALFFDIDGTLIGGGISELSPGLVNELKRIKAMGNVIFVATGRPKPMVGPNIYNDLFDGYIFANGGYIEVNHQEIYRDTMDYELLVELCKNLREHHFEYMIETCNHIYKEKQYIQLFEFFNRIKMTDFFIYDFDEDDKLHRTVKIECDVPHERRKELDQLLEDLFHGAVKHDVHGTNNIYEIYPSTLSKALGIQKVLDHYSIPLENTYAFGDGTNDIEMIKYASTGVAMGNAEEIVKESADVICDRVENHGLEKYLKEVF